MEISWTVKKIVELQFSWTLKTISKMQFGLNFSHLICHFCFVFHRNHLSELPCSLNGFPFKFTSIPSHHALLIWTPMFLHQWQETSAFHLWNKLSSPSEKKLSFSLSLDLREIRWEFQSSIDTSCFWNRLLEAWLCFPDQGGVQSNKRRRIWGQCWG